MNYVVTLLNHFLKNKIHDWEGEQFLQNINPLKKATYTVIMAFGYEYLYIIILRIPSAIMKYCSSPPPPSPLLPIVRMFISFI